MIPQYIPIDLESEPNPSAVDRFIKPYPAFDPDSVKYGNTKDPIKRKEKLESSELEHKDGESAYWENAHKRAALNPITANIICIGFILNGESCVIAAPTEKETLSHFWTLFDRQDIGSCPMISWGGNGSQYENFDADFIIRRSWICGVKISPTAFSGKYPSSRFVNLTNRYLLGKRDAYCSLSDAADQLGLFESHPELMRKDKQNDLVTGENFHLFYSGKAVVEMTPEAQRQFALKYLKNDTAILSAIAEHIL